MNSEEQKSRTRTGVRAMYTGTLIKDIMAIVERSEARIRDANPENELERWYASQHQSVHVDADLVGVA